MTTNFRDTIANSNTEDIMVWAGCSREYATSENARAFELAVSCGGTAEIIAEHIYFSCGYSDGDTLLDNFFIKMIRRNLVAPTLIYMRNAKIVEVSGEFDTIEDMIENGEWSFT